MEARESVSAEAADRGSRTDYRGIFDAIDEAILIHDVDTGDIVDFNRGMCEMFGYTREEAGRLKIGDLCGRESVQSVETLRGLLEKTAGGKSLTIEWRPVTSSGRRFWAEVSLKRITVESRERALVVVRDISQRKQAEEALQESETRFRLVTEGSLAGVYILQDRNFVYVNPILAQIFGYEVEEILGGEVQPAALVHPEDLSLVREHLRKRLEGEERSVRYTFRGLRQDGTVIYCEVLGSTMEYQGRPAVMGTLVDITERIQAGKALKESEARYRAIVEDQAELVTRYRPDFTVSFWNEACCRYFQISPDKVLGHSFLPYIPEADRARVVASITGLTRENPTGVIEHRVIKSDGEIAWQQWTNRAIFDDQGKVIEYQAVGRDITDRRQAEEALRTQSNLLNHVFTSAPEMLMLKDSNFVYQAVNPALCRFLSKTAAEIVGKTDFDLFPREEAEQSRRDDHGVMEEGVPIIHDKELTGPAGKKWFQVIKTPVMDKNGPPLGILCSVTDISGRKEAEEALKESEERYRSLFQNNHATMLLIDPETAAIVDANPAACSFYGYRKEELTAKKITDLNALPSDQVFREMSRAQSRQKNLFFFQHRLADGQLRQVEVVSGPIRVHGRELLYSIIHDVTERKKAEEALRETSNALQTLILASPLAIAALDQDHNIMMWNPAAEHIFGWTAAEVLGRRIPTIPEDQLGETAARIQRELQGEAQSGLELRRLRKDGALIDVQLWTAPLRNARGEIIGTLGVFADISERKRGEEAMLASEAKYRTLVEQIPAVTYISALDNVTSHIYISPQIETVLGFSQEEWLADPESFKNRIHPEDRDRVLSELILSYSQGGPFASEYRLQSKSGRIVWVRDESRAVYDAKGLPLFMQGVALDITARKEAEEALREANSRLKTLVQASPLAIVAVDPDTKVMSWNPAAERIFGWSSHEVMGRPLPYIQKEEKKNFRRLYRRILQGETARGLELRRQRRDGSLADVSLSAAPLYDAAGKIAGIMGVLEDITRRKKIEAALRQAREELEQRVAERTKELLQANQRLHREIEIRRQREATIGAQRDLAIALSGKMGIGEALMLCTEAAMQVSGLDCGGVYLVDKTSGASSLAYHIGLSPEFVRRVARHGPDSPNARLVKAGEPVYLRGGQMADLLDEQGLKEGLRAAAVIPVLHEGRVIACLNIASRVLDEVPEAVRAPLEAIAAQIGSAIARVEAAEALRESEARFNAFMDHLPGVSFMMDANNRLVYLNENLDGILRQMPDVQVSGDFRDKNNAEIWPPAKYKHDNQQVLRQKRSLEFIEPLMQEDGLHSWLIHKFPIMGQDGLPLLVGGIGIDITRRIRAEDDLRRAKAELEIKVAERTAQLAAANETLKMELEERRKTAEALRESEARFRAVFEGAGIGVALVDLQVRVAAVNPALVEMLGYTQEELGRIGIEEITHPDDWAADAALYSELAAGKRNNYQLEKRYFHKNGQQVWGRLTVSLVRGAAGEPQFAISMVEDITERKRAEEELRGQAELLELAHDAILVRDSNNRIVFWNRGATETYGWEQAEALGKVPHELLKTEFPRPLAEIEAELLRQGQWQGEIIHTRRNGQRIAVTSRWVLRQDPQGRPSAILEINRDITERVRAEEAADEVRRQQAAILGNILDLAWLKDPESRFIAVNEPFGRACGMEPENLPGKTDLDIWPLELAQRYRNDDREVMRTGQSKRVEEPLADKEGNIVWIETVKTPIFSEKGEVIGTTGIARDITRRRQMEEALKKVSRALKAITECHQAMMRASREEELLNEVCRIIEEVGGYLMAWVGYAEHDRDKTVRPVAKKGFDADYVRMVKVTWSESATGRGPVGTAIRKGKPAICRDTRIDADFAPWRQQALERGYASLLALPLKHHQTFGALAIYAAEPNAFDDEEINLLLGLANDLAYGITALRGGAERQRAEEALRKSEEALRESESKLRLLTSQVLTIQEQERRRVSRELHDELGQALTVLKIHLVAIETRLRKDQKSLKGDCEQLLNYIDGVIENVRRLSWDLSPSILEDLGLSSSLGYLIDEICRSNNLSCSMAMDEIDHLFAPETRIHIYRIFQESLNNIAKHAQASHISVAMQQEGDRVTFRLKDNGIGFDQEQVMTREVDQRGLGLTAMNERALMAGGTLSIWSENGQGTQITFHIPLDR